MTTINKGRITIWQIVTPIIPAVILSFAATFITTKVKLAQMEMTNTETREKVIQLNEVGEQHYLELKNIMKEDSKENKIAQEKILEMLTDIRIQLQGKKDKEYK